MIIETIIITGIMLKNEAEYVDKYCKGEQEVVLWDRTRVDCLLEDEAQEYDFGVKGEEGIGQSLWYAMNTGRIAGLVLIIEDNRDRRQLMRTRRIIEHYNLPIRLTVIMVEPKGD